MGAFERRVAYRASLRLAAAARTKWLYSSVRKAGGGWPPPTVLPNHRIRQQLSQRAHGAERALHARRPERAGYTYPPPAIHRKIELKQAYNVPRCSGKHRGDVLSGQAVEDSHEYRYNYDKRENLTLEENCQRTTQGSK